jgi:hypothetical protein
MRTIFLFVATVLAVIGTAVAILSVVDRHLTTGTAIGTLTEANDHRPSSGTVYLTPVSSVTLIQSAFLCVQIVGPGSTPIGLECPPPLETAAVVGRGETAVRASTGGVFSVSLAGGQYVAMAFLPADICVETRIRIVAGQTTRFTVLCSRAS